MPLVWCRTAGIFEYSFEREMPVHFRPAKSATRIPTALHWSLLCVVLFYSSVIVSMRVPLAFLRMSCCDDIMLSCYHAVMLSCCHAILLSLHFDLRLFCSRVVFVVHMLNLHVHFRLVSKKFLTSICAKSGPEPCEFSCCLLVRFQLGHIADVLACCHDGMTACYHAFMLQCSKGMVLLLTSSHQAMSLKHCCMKAL